MIRKNEKTKEEKGMKKRNTYLYKFNSDLDKSKEMSDDLLIGREDILDRTIQILM